MEEWREIGRDINSNSTLEKLQVLGMIEDIDPLLRENTMTDDKLENLRQHFRMLDNNKAVSELLIYRINFSNANIFQSLAPMLQKNRRLVNFILDQCELGLIGVSSLSFLLRKSSSIKHIYLSYNGNGNDSIGVLVAALNMLPELEVLDLERNRIGMHGCCILANMLKHPISEMKRIGLQYNRIDDEGAAISENSLRNNTKVTHMDLELKPDHFKAKSAFAKTHMQFNQSHRHV